MPAKPKRRRQEPDLETNSDPDVSDNLRRRDPSQAPPDSLPERGEERPVDDPNAGGMTPMADGGNPQHPIHDEDREDATPGDYEREIDRLDAAVDRRIR